MESNAKAAGHPIHQQLIVFPLGLLGTAVLFDLLRLATDNGDFATASYLSQNVSSPPRSAGHPSSCSAVCATRRSSPPVATATRPTSGKYQ